MARSLYLLLGLAACGDKQEPVVAAQVAASPVVTPSRDAAPAPAPSNLPPGWRREDLVKHHLAATIAVPADATVTPGQRPERDLDGLAIALPIVTIKVGSGPAIELSTDLVLGWVPTTAAVDRASNEHSFPVVDAQESKAGEWAIAYRWTDGACFVHGWSPRAKVWCTAPQLEIPCAATGPLLKICASMEPSGPPIVTDSDPAVAFPQFAELPAATAAVQVVRAIMHDDHAALLDAIDPKGLMLKGKRVTPKGLRGLLHEDTIQRTFDINCRTLPGQRGTPCRWVADGAITNHTAAILSNDGYGPVPRVTLEKVGERWLVTKVDLLDQGEP